MSQNHEKTTYIGQDYVFKRRIRKLLIVNRVSRTAASNKNAKENRLHKLNSKLIMDRAKETE